MLSSDTEYNEAQSTESMLRVYSNISISASRKASDLTFHTCHFQILRNWPKHSSNLTYSGWLQDQGHTDTIDRKKRKPLFHQILEEKYATSPWRKSVDSVIELIIR